MPNLRSDGKPKSGMEGRVKAVSRASGRAIARALTRPASPAHTSIIRSPLTAKTVALPAIRGERRRRSAQPFLPNVVYKRG